MLSKYVLNPYWNQLVKLWPTWVAPNTVRSASISMKLNLKNICQITFTGLSLVFINFFTMMLYDPAYLTQKHGAPGPPQWLYYTCVDPYALIRLGAKMTDEDGQQGCLCTRVWMR